MAEKTAQIQAGKAVVTATVAMTMDPYIPAFLHILSKGKTAASIPTLSILTAGRLLRLTRRSSCGWTLASVRLALNFDTGCFSLTWLFFTSKELDLPERIHIIFMAPGATSYLQPLDRAVLKSWKSGVFQEANKMMASLALEGDQDFTESFNFPKPSLNLIRNTR
eukprot:2822605-Amphidinium_carterae.1